MTAWDTGDWNRRRRVRIRGPVTLLVLLGLLGGAAWFGYNSVLGPAEETPLVCNTPGVDGKQQISAAGVTINVYNAGEQYGLAADVAEELRKRGFLTGAIDNDPLESNVQDVEIRGRDAEAPEVLLLGEQVAGEKVKADGRTTYDVDLVLGDKFKDLVKKGPAELTVESPLAACTTSPPDDT